MTVIEPGKKVRFIKRRYIPQEDDGKVRVEEERLGTIVAVLRPYQTVDTTSLGLRERKISPRRDPSVVVVEEVERGLPPIHHLPIDKVTTVAQMRLV